MSGIQVIGVVGLLLLLGPLVLFVFWLGASVVIDEHRRGDHGTIIFMVSLTAFLVLLLVFVYMAKGKLG